MSINRINVQSPDALEYDDAYIKDGFIDSEDILECRARVLILDGERTYGPLRNVSYVWVDPKYTGELSPGQKEVYDLLLMLQTIGYVETTIGFLADTLALTVPHGVEKRLERLSDFQAISGFRLY